MSFHPALVSITFRSLNCEQIIDLCRKAKVEGIEWGGDVHVPHGDVALAAEVARRTRDAGLAVSSYGSYYRAGEPTGEKQPDFRAVLDSAVALGAPTIRVWAGRCAPKTASAADRKRIAEDLLRIADLARTAGIRVCTEYHAKTLTQTEASARALLFDEARHENLATFWQPVNGAPRDENLAHLESVLPLVETVHTFYWTAGPNGIERHPLADGAADWACYLPVLARTGRNHWLAIEFVRGDTPEQFLADAATLRGWTKGNGE